MIKMHDRIDEKRSCMHLVRFHTVWSVAKQKKTSTEYLNPYLIPNNKEAKFFSIYFFVRSSLSELCEYGKSSIALLFI
jgi:hypothetical protein